MEGVEYFKKVRIFGLFKNIKTYITSSTRKFRERKIIKIQLMASLLMCKYFLGANIQKTYELKYNKKDEEAGGNYICEISGVGEG